MSFCICKIICLVLTGSGVLCFLFFFFFLSLLPTSDCGTSLNVCHLDVIIVSGPPVCQVGIAPQLFTAIASAGATIHAGLCEASVSVFPSFNPISIVHSDIPTFRCLNCVMSQMYLYVEQGIFC